MPSPAPEELAAHRYDEKGSSRYNGNLALFTRKSDEKASLKCFLHRKGGEYSKILIQ
jgi:hypothetical protein